MRKIGMFILTLLSVALLSTPAMVYAECQDGPYDLYINNNKVGTFVDAGMSPDNLPQLNVAASVKKGDKVQFCNASCNEFFFPQTIERGGDVDGGGNFTVAADYATCNVDGCYNFWWKKQYGADKLYIGTDGDCGGTPGGGGSDPITPGGDYSSAVPAQCTDVMLQAFYWNSNSDGTYGTSKWNTLKSQASEIGQYFQLIWLPPSCVAEDAMGYLPKQYHNQSSKMGNQSELTSLITSLHNNGVRVLADVVINHASNKSSWIDFWEQDFGSYGKFQPNSTWITSDDEAKGKGTLSTNADDGQESNKNYGAARDWDHKKADVQNMCKAYLQFLKGTMKYDGYRFDYCVGFHVSHINDYVSAAKPYISVMEYWNGDANTLKTRIDQAGKNTMTFDFALFHNSIQKGIAKNAYGNLVNGGMRGKSYQKYAVTFVDNHDTFNRSDNADCGNKKDGSSINDKELIMQSNAYILSMPGIPCVFYPHWYKYKTDIKAMITARRSAGIHSESAVTENSGSGYYEATITGKTGKVILYLGSSASKAAPSGYKQAVKGSKYAMYYTGTMPTTDIEQTQTVKLPLNTNEPMFNIMGQQVDANYRGIVIQNGNKYILQ